MDRIRIRDLRFFGRHGVLPEENRLGQPFLVSLSLEADLEPAGRSDDLTRSIDYRKLVRLAGEVVEGPPVRLLETLAERIAARVLNTFPIVRSVTVEVGKPNPPLPLPSSGAFVEIRRSRRE